MKNLLSLFFLLTALAASAATYTGSLQTKAPEGTTFTPVETTVEITENADGTYNFQLNNWMYGMNGHNMGLGTLVVNDIEATVENGLTVLNAEVTTSLEKGTDSSVYYWVATYMGEIPVTVYAKFNEEKLYAEVSADGSVKPGYSLYEATFGEDDFPVVLPEPKVYTGSLQTKAPEGTTFTPVETTVEITENADGTYNFQLNNWMYGMNGHNMGLGTLVVNDIEATVENGLTVLNAEVTTSLEKGTDSSVYYWVATYMGEVPVTVYAAFNDENLYAEVSADGSVKPGYSKYEAVFGDKDLVVSVADIEAVAGNAVEIYTLDGRKVSKAEGGMFVIRYSDGSVRKVAVR